MEGEAFVAAEPGADLQVLVGGGVVENDMHGFVLRHTGIDGVQESDELLMAMTLHVASDDSSVEHVESGEQRRRSVALVVMVHGPKAAFLQRQARLGAVERLDLAFLVN